MFIEPKLTMAELAILAAIDKNRAEVDKNLLKTSRKPIILR
jgi:hypothetical protein